MKNRIKNVQIIFSKNKKVVENYFFMTLLQVLNSLFYFLIYPFLIRTLGIENYGLYVFALSIITFFMSFVSFGFDLPAAKAIALSSNDELEKSKILSSVFTAKVYLFIFSAIILSFLVILIPSLKTNWVLYFIVFIQIISGIFFPQWYFQGIQRMSIVTYIQLAFKLISLPFIFLLIHKGVDYVWIFALIISLSNILGGFMASYIIRFRDNLKINWMPLDIVKIYCKDALPFFWTSSITIVKQQSISIIIGSYFGMRDVALYDLAYKIFSIPNILFGSINGALFPKIAKENNKDTIKKILKWETYAGLAVIVAVVLLGEYVVLFLGGPMMLDSYPIAIVLSFGVLTFLLVSGYINFIFVPKNRYYLITQNQVIAFIVFVSLTVVGLVIWKNILSIALAWSIAGLFEIAYCKFLIKKYKLM
ncbi:PST family polysaccharide transporter [Flavobacterium sp. PL11]|jgi:PST family polysaccharide transporter|uniref:oligosaccharide flippase family protein n=1 Tax=Flavobacterium sp. PL11 TaxID=3071717 RepID=UPI002E03C4D0|nr:PST family polysaccharide transporter [Flavobacterium sp. PL11]